MAAGASAVFSGGPALTQPLLRITAASYAETLVLDKRPSSSRPAEGLVTFAHTARNQRGEIVATATRKTLVRMAPP